MMCSREDRKDTDLLKRESPEKNPIYSTSIKSSIRLSPMINCMSLALYSSESAVAARDTHASTLGSLDQKSDRVVMR